MKDRTKQIGMDFGDGYPCKIEFILFENIITDRKSKYSVSGGRATNREDIKKILKKLKSKRKYQKATHNTWAARISHEGKIFEIKNDDGELGAGNVLLRTLQKHQALDLVVIVTRWFGGIKLQGDRFKHVKDAGEYFLEQT